MRVRAMPTAADPAGMTTGPKDLNSPKTETPATDPCTSGVTADRKSEIRTTNPRRRFG